MRPFRPLLPKAAQVLPEATSSNEELAPKRRRMTTPVACESCRRRKLRCDGQRPTCQRCSRGRIACSYQTADEHPSAIQERNESLLQENEQLKELFALIHTRSQPEALEIFGRIRATKNPIAVLDLVKHADLLLPNHAPGAAHDPELARLESEALSSSWIKVPARPWTLVAGDGVVSALVSDFFANDHGYLVPFIPRDAFLKDMRSQSLVDAKYCSSLLVNAICALKCLTCQKAKKMGQITRNSMVERFLAECKKLIELSGGVETLPAAQAYCLVYLTSALLGRDRAGSMYRYAAYEILRRLHLEEKFGRLDDDEPEGAWTKQIISKVLWGFFCFEGRMAYFYSEPSMLRPPSIPNLFDEQREFEEGNQESSADALHTSPPGLFGTLCALSEIFYEIMVFNSTCSISPDSDENLSKRAGLYVKFKQWRMSLPETFQVEKHFTVHNCHLQMHISETAFSILQLLPPSTRLPGENVTVGKLCVGFCESDSVHIERYMNQLPPDPLLGRGLFVSLSILAPFLDDAALHPLFTRQCGMLRRCLIITPLVKSLLKGVQASVWGLNKTMPYQARPFFQGLDDEQPTRDLPISFSLPHRDEIRRLLSGEGDENAHDMGVRLSVLVSSWARSSLEFA